MHLLAARDLPHWLSALSALPRSRGVPEPSARLTADKTESVVLDSADALAEAELTLEELGSQVIDRAGAPGPVTWSCLPSRRCGHAGVRRWGLLPYFDAYAVGCHPRERLFPGAAAERALARGQAGNRPVLLVDGVVAGVWHHRRAGRRIDITVEPLTTLTAARRRLLDAEVERLGAILEGAVEARVGAVTVGPHA